MQVMVPTEVCMVCQRVGIPVKSYEVRSDGRSGAETLCAEHAETLEQILAAGSHSNTDAAPGSASPGKKSSQNTTTGKTPTKRAAKRTPTKQSAATKSATKSARKSASGPVEDVRPRRMRGPASKVMTMDEIEALREKPDA